ncbi:MAG: Na+/H+ antiporter subunit E [Trueperella sp.]|nr:Na+/H+ antiporter subunit E [Trueperella sp.]
MSKSSRAIRIATQRPGRFPHASIGLILWLTLVWVMLWGSFTAANLLAGLLVALILTTLAPFPALPFDGRFRPGAVLYLVVRFLWDIVYSSFQQGWFILSGRQPQGTIIRIHLRSHSDAYLSMVAGMTALVPGSVAVDAHRITGTIYVHVFDTDLAGGIPGIHRTVLELEERVLRAFASHDELVDAGYVPGAWSSAGRLPTPYAPATGEPLGQLADPRAEVRRAAQARRHEEAQRIAGNVLPGEQEETS